MEDDSEEYEDEILVVELSGVPNPDVVLQSTGPCSVLGLDTPEPLLQLENYIFKGKYEDSIGTCLLFRENGKELTYECATTKRLCMSRVILKKKSTASASGGQDGGQDMISRMASHAPQP